MADRDIAVKFTGDAKDLERASDKAEKSISGASKGMGGALAGLAGPAAIAGGAIIGLGAAAFSFADAALEDDAAAASLAQNLRTAAGASDEAIASAEDYISTLSKTAAITDDELRPALSKLAVATGDTAKAQDLLGLATDIAAGTGKDLGSVADALAKAQLGNTGALGKMGLATKDAAGETMSLEQVLDSARGKFKGAAEAAGNTAAGGMKKAQIGMGELQEQIGAKLLPVLGALGAFMVDSVIPAFEGVVAWVEEQWPKLLEIISPTLTAIQEKVSVVLAAITALWAEWGDEVLTVLAFVVGLYIKYIQTILTVYMTVISWIVGAGQAFWDQWGEQIVATLKTVAEFVVEFVKNLIVGFQIVAKFLADFWAEWGDEITKFVRLVTSLVTTVVTRIASLLASYVSIWVNIISVALKIVIGVVKFALDFVQFLWGMWGEGIMRVVGDIMGIVVAIIQNVMAQIVNVIKFFTAIFTGDWSGAWQALLETTKLGLFFLGNLMGRIGGLVVDALAGVITIITTPFRIAFNTIADIWNSTVGALSFNFPDWVPGLGGRGIEVPDIPRFSSFGAMTIVMPPGSDGYDVARQVQTFSRSVAPMGSLTVAVR